MSEAGVHGVPGHCDSSLRSTHSGAALVLAAKQFLWAQDHLTQQGLAECHTMSGAAVHLWEEDFNSILPSTSNVTNETLNP